MYVRTQAAICLTLFLFSKKGNCMGQLLLNTDLELILVAYSEQRD